MSLDGGGISGGFCDETCRYHHEIVMSEMRAEAWDDVVLEDLDDFQPRKRRRKNRQMIHHG